MNIEYHKWWSHNLCREMEYKVYGHDGQALLAVQQRIANVLRLPLVPARPDTCQALAALNRELEQY